MNIGWCFSLRAQEGKINDSDSAKIIQAVVDMWDAIEKGDLPRYSQYIHADHSSFGESDAYLSQGKKKEVNSIKDFISRSRGVHTEMHQPEVMIRDNTAWLTYYWSDYGVVNGTRYTSRGKSTRIFVKEEDKWLCIHSHFTELP